MYPQNISDHPSRREWLRRSWLLTVGIGICLLAAIHSGGWNRPAHANPLQQGTLPTGEGTVPTPSVTPSTPIPTGQGTIPTPGTTPATPIPTTGDALITLQPGQPASLSYNKPGGGKISIEVPAGAVSETVALVYDALTMPTQGRVFEFAGHSFTLNAFRGTSQLNQFVFQQPIVFVIEYTDSDIAGLDESKLTLLYYDVATSAWLGQGITLVQHDRANNRITFQVTHLTEFVLAVATGSDTCSVAAQTMYNGTGIEVVIGTIAADLAVPDARLDQVIITGQTPSKLCLRGVMRQTPYTGLRSMATQTNLLLTQGCPNNSLCNSVRRVIIAADGSYTIEIISQLQVIRDVYLPLVPVSCLVNVAGCR